MVQLHNSQPIKERQIHFHTKSERFWKLNLFFGTSRTSSYLSAIFRSASRKGNACRICFLTRTKRFRKKLQSFVKILQDCQTLLFGKGSLILLARAVSALAAPNFATNLILALQPFTINHTRANTGPYKSHRAHVSLYLAVQPLIATNKPKKIKNCHISPGCLDLHKRGGQTPALVLRWRTSKCASVLL